MPTQDPPPRLGFVRLLSRSALPSASHEALALGQLDWRHGVAPHRHVQPEVLRRLNLATLVSALRPFTHRSAPALDPEANP
jgi:hypothetical protein